jgi:hypothetical protein
MLTSAVVIHAGAALVAVMALGSESSLMKSSIGSGTDSGMSASNTSGISSPLDSTSRQSLLLPNRVSEVLVVRPNSERDSVSQTSQPLEIPLPVVNAGYAH